MRTMNDEGELKYWVALAKVPGVGPKRFIRLIRAFGSAEEAFHASPERLTEAVGDEPLVSNLIKLREVLDPDREWGKIRNAGVRVITVLDSEYPDRLKEIHDPPPLLYVKSEDAGSLREKLRHSVGIVGTRTPTPYGRSVAHRLARELGELGITVVSGLARGIDSMAHKGALASGANTVAVVGTGLDVVYPPENAELAQQIASEGAIISEFHMGTPASPGNFPARNRIISGCCEGVIVVEAGQRSGALITANLALDQGREVFAVPGPITSEKSKGCNRLIKQGAALVESVEDVIAELPELARSMLEKRTEREPRLDRRSFAHTGDDAGKIIDILRQAHAHPGGAISVEEVVTLSGLPPERVHVCLLDLELRGICQRFPDGKYALSESNGI